MKLEVSATLKSIVSRMKKYKCPPSHQLLTREEMDPQGFITIFLHQILASNEQERMFSFGVCSFQCFPTVQDMQLYTKTAQHLTCQLVFVEEDHIAPMQLRQLQEFNAFIFQHVFSFPKELITYAPGTKSYLFVPFDLQHGRPQIVWSVVESILEYERNGCAPDCIDWENVDLEDLLKDKIVVSNGRAYAVEKLDRSKSAASPFPKQYHGSGSDGSVTLSFADYYQNIYGISVDVNQPLILARLVSTRIKAYNLPNLKKRRTGNSSSASSRKTYVYLIPEICHLHPISTTQWSDIGYLVSIMHQFERSLLRFEFRQNVLKSIRIKESLLLLALTCPQENANLHQNNDRLEFLGDAVLNAIVTVKVLWQYFSSESRKRNYDNIKSDGSSTQIVSSCNISIMRQQRHALLGNNRLLEAAEGIRLGRYICVNPLGSKQWIPPGIECSWENEISSKTMANCMEAIIGAIYRSTGVIDSSAELLESIQYFKNSNIDAKLLPVISKDELVCLITADYNFQPKSPLMFANMVGDSLNYKFNEDRLLIAVCNPFFKPGISKKKNVFQMLGKSLINLFITSKLCSHSSPYILSPGKMSQIREILLTKNLLGYCLINGCLHNLPKYAFSEQQLLYLEIYRKLNVTNVVGILEETISSEFRELFESIVGAVYMDSDIVKVQEVLCNFMDTIIEEVAKVP